MNNLLRETLEELLTETKLQPIGISNRDFDTESNHIAQAQANTIIKLALKNIEKLEIATNKLLEKSLEIETKLDQLDNKLEILSQKSGNQSSTQYKNIIGPKSFYPSKTWN